MEALARVSEKLCLMPIGIIDVFIIIIIINFNN